MSRRQSTARGSKLALCGRPTKKIMDSNTQMRQGRQEHTKRKQNLRKNELKNQPNHFKHAWSRTLSIYSYNRVTKNTTIFQTWSRTQSITVFNLTTKSQKIPPSYSLSLNMVTGTVFHCTYFVPETSMCVCVCVCVRERERERESDGDVSQTHLHNLGSPLSHGQPSACIYK